MSILRPEVIQEENLSRAWARMCLTLIEHPDRLLTPLFVSVTDFQEDGLPAEDPFIRQALDVELARRGKVSVDTSAMLIFPLRPWLRRGRPSCTDFSDWYLQKFLPRLKARDARNRRGTYFERMIAHTGVKYLKDGQVKIGTSNQLEHIVKVWERDLSHGTHPRHSALQVSCFDPVKDHTGGSRFGFPCLSHLNFAYQGDQLSMMATYPVQYILDRGYGNYLGLCHLGHFMAHEMGLRFSRFTCSVGHPALGHQVSKASLSQFRDTLRSHIDGVEPETQNLLRRVA